MTYQDIANWCEKNVPMNQASSKSEWISMCEQEFLNSGHFLPEESIPFIEKKWELKHPDVKEDPQQTRIEQFEQEQERTGFTKKELIQKKLISFPADIEFTPLQFSKFAGTNKNTTRREFQQLEREGFLTRTRKGVYKLA